MDTYIEIKQAASLIKNGELVAFPTETVYGLGSSVFNIQAVEKIFEVKGRPQDNPLIVHISSLEQLDSIVSSIPKHFELLAKAFFPGPLTILLPKKPEVPSIVSAGLPTIGVRMPNHPLALELISACGTPLVAPSANLSGRPSCTTAQHVFDDFGNTVAGIIDGGPCLYGLESTVVQLEPYPALLRPGMISKEQLEQVLQTPLFQVNHTVDKPLCPGMKYRHYAPNAKVRPFYSKKQLETYLIENPKVNRTILESVQPEELYSSLRLADNQHRDEIVIFCDEKMLQNPALMNRISRASQ